VRNHKCGKSMTGELCHQEGLLCASTSYLQVVDCCQRCERHAQSHGQKTMGGGASSDSLLRLMSGTPPAAIKIPKAMTIPSTAYRGDNFTYSSTFIAMVTAV
jgi:hypothetical protein